MLHVDQLKLKYTFTVKQGTGEYTCLQKLAEGDGGELWFAISTARDYSRAGGAPNAIWVTPEMRKDAKKPGGGGGPKKTASGGPKKTGKPKAAKKKTGKAAKKKAAKKTSDPK